MDKFDIVFAAIIGGFLLMVVALFAWVIFTSPGSEPGYVLRPYEGPGNGVLKHGIVLKEEYQGPQSISGELDIKGIWILEEK